MPAERIRVRGQVQGVRPGSPVTDEAGVTTAVDAPLPHNGYAYEAAEVMRCLRSGRLESPVMPLDETLSVMRTLDTCRGQWGLVYPGEGL